jgi:uncharacterized membrane protein
MGRWGVCGDRDRGCDVRCDPLGVAVGGVAMIKDWWNGHATYRNRDVVMNALMMFVFGMTLVACVLRYR